MHIRALLTSFLILFCACLSLCAQDLHPRLKALARISNPESVEYIDLSYSKLSNLDSGLLRFRNLKTLDLRGNDLQSLPTWISEFSELKVLKLSGNEKLLASSLSSVYELPLRELYLASCNMVYIPEKIKELSSLEELDLGNNLLSVADAILFELPLLRVLNLSNNFIDTLESFNSDNISLEWIDLSANPIVNKDEQLKKLDRVKNLKHLGLQGCYRFPTSIGRISSLSSLDLRNGSLKDLNPVLSNLENLERLCLSNCPNINYTNAFTIIGQLKKLRYLELGYPNSRSTVIPDQIRHLKDLQTLIIDNGMQVDLNSLMLDLAKLPELKELRIRGGKYESLSNEVFRLTKLEKFDFSDNQCSELPFELNNMKHLRELDLRGNNIKPDRIENLEDALKGYCYIRSDYNFKSNALLQAGKPLVSNGKPAVRTVSMNAESGGTVDCGEGVKLNVPAGALLVPNGKPASGEVNFKFRDLSSPLSFSLAGISMNYDSNGHEFLLSSAGMFELNCEQNGQQLKIAEGKKISVTMPGTDPGRKYKVYQYDASLNTWIEQAGESKEGSANIPAAPAPVKRPDFNYRIHKEKFNFSHTKVKNEQSFTFGIVNYESPAPTSTAKKTSSEGHHLYCFELANFTSVTWIYDGSKASEDYKKLFQKGSVCIGSSVDEVNKQKRSIAITKVNDIRIKPNPDGSDNFLMEFYIDKELVASLPVLPLKYANDPSSIQKRIKRQYSRYSRDLELRLSYYKNAEDRYDSAYAEFERKMEVYREYIKVNRRKSSRQTGLVERTLDIGGFGTWNHDISFRMRNPKQIRIDRIVSMEGGVDLKPSQAVIVDLSFYSSFSTEPFLISFDYSDKNIALFPLGDDKIGILYDEELKAMSAEGRREAKVKVIDCKGRSHEEILTLIGI